MKHTTFILLVGIFLAIGVLERSASAENWPQWRGPALNGVSNEKNLPVKWTTEENVVWKLAMPGVSGSTPIIWRNHIFLNVADNGNLFLWAVDKTKGEVLWKKPDAAGDVKLRKHNMSSPSPVTDGKYFYIVNDRGIVWCLDAKTGAEIYGQQRIKPAIYSGSPVLADGKIYVTNEEGLTTVIAAGPKFEVLAENALNDFVLSSPAISDGRIYIRTSQNLYAIGTK